MSQKRPHVSISLREKLEIIEAAKTEKNHSELARRFNKPRQTIVDILNKEDSILQGIDHGFGPKRKRMRTSKFSEMEKQLLNWFASTTSKNVPVTDHLMQVSPFCLM